MTNTSVTSITSISRMPNPAEFVPELNDISAALALVEATLQPAPHGRERVTDELYAEVAAHYDEKAPPPSPSRSGRSASSSPWPSSASRSRSPRWPTSSGAEGPGRPPQAPLGPVGPGLGGRGSGWAEI